MFPLIHDRSRRKHTSCETEDAPACASGTHSPFLGCAKSKPAISHICAESEVISFDA